MSTMAFSSNEPDRLSPAAAWSAVAERDSSYDGRFVYAVRSTGVFCKPSCPSRRPLRANVEFFSSTTDAERAGFRACRRCRPTSESAHPGIERAKRYLDEHAERAVPLEELARHVGLSASHLQRSFKQAIGRSPKEYQADARMVRFKARLRAGDTVSRATYEAGFGSSSRVYEH